MDLEKILDKTIEYGFYGLFFLVPLIVTPWNFELFEYNKMMLTYFLTVVIVGAWISKMILRRQVLIKRTPFDIPITLFLISQLLSTIFSIDRHTSFWGYYSRFHGGLLSTATYILLYYALVANFDRKKVINSLYWLLSTAAVISVYGILEHFGRSISCLVFEGKFGVSCWVQDVQTRVFATLGQPNWLAAWIIILIPILVAFLINKKFEAKVTKNLKLMTYYLLLIIYYLVLLYTKSRSGLAGLAVSWVVFWGIYAFSLRENLKRVIKPFVIFNLTLLLITLLVGTDFTPSLGQVIKKVVKKVQAAETVIAPTPTIIPEVVRGGTESYEIRKIVWKGSVAIWRHWPIFGSGVETFAYSYYHFRPVEHNLVSEWDFLYNKAHNEYLNFAATTGTVGLLTYLLLIFWIVFWGLKNLKCQISDVKSTSKSSKLKSDSTCSFSLEAGSRSAGEFCVLSFALFSGWLSIPVSNFFGFSVVPVALLFFLFPAANVVLASISRGAYLNSPPEWSKYEERKSVSLGQYTGVGVVFLVCLALLFLLSRYWYADVLYAKSKKAERQGEYSQSYDLAQKAVNLNPGEPLYHDSLSFAAASLAEQASLQKQESLAQQFALQAVAESDETLATSPQNLNFWRTRAKDFYKLSNVDRKYLQDALLTLKRATELAPTEAKIFYNLALVYLQLGQTQEAIDTLEKTVEMKKNYQDARYALGLIYQQVGNIPKAIEHVEYSLTYINSSVKEIRALYKNLTGHEFGSQ